MKTKQTFLIQGVYHNGRESLGTNYGYFIDCKSIHTIQRTKLFKKIAKNLQYEPLIHHYNVYLFRDYPDSKPLMQILGDYYGR